MEMARQFIECTPVPKGRPRITTRGRFPVVYTPPNTAKFEAFIAKAWAAGFFTKEKPLRVNIVVMFLPPKSWPKKRVDGLQDKAFREIPRGDVDNYAKSVLDALNGVAYDDDAQIVELIVRKNYNPVAEGLFIEIEEVTTN